MQGGAGLANPTAKFLRQGPQEARHTSRQLLIYRVEECLISSENTLVAPRARSNRIALAVLFTPVLSICILRGARVYRMKGCRWLPTESVLAPTDGCRFPSAVKSGILIVKHSILPFDENKNIS